MRPQLLAGFRFLRRRPGRVLQVVFAVALGVALFVSSYVSIGGVEESIHHSARAMAGNAQWVVTGAGSGGLPESVLDRIRTEPGVTAAPFLSAYAMLLGDRSEKLHVMGVDSHSDAMLRFFGSRSAPSLRVAAALVLMPNSVLIPESIGAEKHLRAGSTLKVITRVGPQELTVAGTFADTPGIRALGGDIALMNVQQAETLFGQPGMLDSIEVSGVSQDRLTKIVEPYTVRPVDSLSPAAQDALLRVQSLYGLSLVAMLIGCFVVYSSVQVSVLDRIKQLATFRAIGASRLQLLAAILLEWFCVGLIGSVAGLGIGIWLSSVTLQAVTGDVNAMVPIVHDTHPLVTAESIVLGVGVGLVTVLAAALFPALSAIRESPLLALRPHTYRLRHSRPAPLWLGMLALLAGMVMSVGGSVLLTLCAIAVFFLGLALMMPQAVLMLDGAVRIVVARVFGFVGFLAADNLRKAPQRTAFNVIALGGALSIMVATSALVQGLTRATHNWIRDSLPLDISLSAWGLGFGLYSEETVPRSLIDQVEKVPGVSFVYGVRKTFASFGGHDVMVVGIPTPRYVEAHRRRGTLGWAHAIAEPKNVKAMQAGTGVFVSDNLLDLAGLRVGDSVSLNTPLGLKSFKILGSLEDYSWPRGLFAMDLDVMGRLWKSTALTYVDVQVADPAQVQQVKRSLIALTRDEFGVRVSDRNEILAITDSVLHQSTAIADVQVWLAAIIGFLGIGNSLVIGVLQRQREIGLLRAVGISRRQLQLTVAIEATLIGVGAGILGVVGGLVGGWMPLRHFTFAVTGYLFPIVVPWDNMAEVFALAILIAVIAALVPARRIARVPVLTSIAVE